MKRNAISPRFSTDASRGRDFARLAETAQRALDTIPLVSFRRLRVTASGTEGAELAAVRWREGDPAVVVAPGAPPPDVALIVRAAAVDAPSAHVALGTALNFGFRVRGGAAEVVLYEPSAMTASGRYDIVVMFLSGMGA